MLAAHPQRFARAASRVEQNREHAIRQVDVKVGRR
jgi:hypothetical protein